jgi:hypothetical protein
MTWPKGKKKSRETVKKMKESALKRWAKKNKKIGILEVAKRIKDEDRESFEEALKQDCPFCQNKIKHIDRGYHYCDRCNMIINTDFRWRVKLPR